MKRCVLTLMLLVCSLTAAAQELKEQPKDIREATPKDLSAAAAKAQEATIDFTGAGFGTGLALVIELGQKRRVADAEVVNGVVRIKKDSSMTPRILLNLHYFFSNACDDNIVDKWCLERRFSDTGSGRSVLVPMRGWGPFVAVQPGSEETIAAVGGGVLWGWRRAIDKPDSFNIGFGVLADQNVRTLGDGIRQNEPLPQGESLRYKQSTRWGGLLMASWAF